MAATQGRILVVDDDTLNRIKLSTNLEELGHSIGLARDGAEALEMLHAQPFDMVLLDLVMPVMDGFQVLEVMKADELLQHMPVVVISAEDDLSSVVRCIEMGADDYLMKPFNPVLLRARVNACLEKKRSHDREMQLFTELQQRYQELRELEKLRDDLTHMIVHDLRTPLTSLLGGMEMIEEMGPLNQDQSHVSKMAMQGGRNLLGMINELLDISKMEDGSLILECTLTKPAELISCAISQVAHLAQLKSVTLQEKIDDNLPELGVDEDKVVRILVNLCGNAIKFTPIGGTVTVAISRVNPEANSHDPAAFDLPPDISPEDYAVLFSVADTGEGIPPEYHDLIFEKFGQVESRKSGKKMSTGLGLTFCKMAVELHGGRIWVESEPGQGSVFSFILPDGGNIFT